MKNKILTQKQRQELIDNRAKLIIESFGKTFNKIKRLDESNDSYLGKWVPPSPEESSLIDKVVKDSGDREEARVKAARAERLKKQSETLGKNIKGESVIEGNGDNFLSGYKDKITQYLGSANLKNSKKQEIINGFDKVLQNPNANSFYEYMQVQQVQNSQSNPAAQDYYLNILKPLVDYFEKSQN